MNKDNDTIPSETDYSSSDEEINRKRESNRLKRVRDEKYIGRKQKWYEREEKIKYELVPKPRKNLKGKPCPHSSISKSERSFLCGLISEEKRKVIFYYFCSFITWDAK
jgi:hypothetical protein